jgi:glyoxylase-like metal-dependent hydrolase (beta-lactamase superfamily II)
MYKIAARSFDLVSMSLRLTQGEAASSMSSIRRLLPLTVAWERLPKSFSVHGDTSGETLVEPVPAVLLDTDDGWLLMDTGMNMPLINDPWLCRRFHARNNAISPITAGGEPLLEEMAAHGVAIDDITRIVLSHLHNDHAGGLRLFPTEVPVFVQATELDYGLRDHPFPEQHGMFRIDYDDLLINWQLLEGDAEIVPGLWAFTTPGHTPGHQSFVVELQDGSGYVLPFDAGDLTENFEKEIGPGGFVHCTAEDARQSLLRVKEVAGEHGYPIIASHDPVAWPEFMKQLAAAPAVG